MKQVKYLILAAVLLAFAPMAEAKGAGLIEVLGATIQIVQEFIGVTSLTPAYQVESWSYQLRQKNMTTLNPDEKVSVDYSLTLNRLTGDWAYWYKSNGGVYGTNSSKEPFPYMHIDTKRFRCVKPVLVNGTTNMIETIEHETHKEFVYVKHVERTGFVPDDGPWTVWLKARSDKVRCFGIVAARDNHYSWISANISRGHGEVVTLGLPNVLLEYPFYIVNESYD